MSMDFFEGIDKTKIVERIFKKPSGEEMTMKAKIVELTGTQIINLAKCSVSKSEIDSLKSGRASDEAAARVAESMNHLFVTAINSMEFHFPDGRAFKANTSEELLYAFSHLSAIETTWLRSEIEGLNPTLKAKDGLSIKKN